MAVNNFSEINWSSVLKTLSAEGLDFVVVGGAALALHGLPRTTLDIDIFIPASKQNFQILFSSLLDNLKLESKQSVFRDNADQPELFVGQWFTFSVKNGNDLVDVFFTDNESFNQLNHQSETITISNQKIRIASLSELRKMKKECGRPIDLADVALIDEIMKKE